jgi:hypothetical protein
MYSVLCVSCSKFVLLLQAYQVDADHDMGGDETGDLEVGLDDDHGEGFDDAGTGVFADTLEDHRSVKRLKQVRWVHLELHDLRF